jgi:hypothetical protein
VRRDVAFRDVASGKDVRMALEPGRAAIVLVSRQDREVARYEPPAMPGN